LRPEWDQKINKDVTLILRIILIGVLGIGLLAFSAQPKSKNLKKGKELTRWCSNCHGTTKGGPHHPLQGIRKYRSQDWLMRFMANPVAMASQDPTANAMFKKAGVIMPAYPTLTKEDINAIFDYLDSLPYDARNYGFRRGWKPL
jgi:hypothetical protein